MEEAPVLTASNAKRAAHELWTKLKGASNKLKAAREKTEASIDSIKQVGEVGLLAFGAAYANQRWGGQAGVVTFAGMPADLAIGATGVLVSLIGVAGKYDEDILNASIGLLVNPIVREGSKLGAQAQASDSQKATGHAGAIPAGNYAGAVPAGNYAGAVPAGNYAGAVPAGNYAGAVPAGNYAGAVPAGAYAGAVPAGAYAGGAPANQEAA